MKFDAMMKIRIAGASGRRKTIRFRLKRAKTTMVEATGMSGVRMPNSNAVATTSRMRNPQMTIRFRLRRSWSLRSGISLGPAHREQGRRHPGGLVGLARQARQEGVGPAVEGGFRVDPHVEQRGRLEFRRREELEPSQLGEHPLRIPELARGVGLAGLAAERRDLEFLREHVVEELTLD